MDCIDQEQQQSQQQQQQQQQPIFKHYCRVCKKGFVCGRALGGHMRAHGIGDEVANIDDDDQVSDWEDKFGGSGKGGNKRLYQLRTNPNRQKSNRVCENCGKEFSSWKSFLEHGKCSSEDGVEESLVSSPGSEGEDYIYGERKEKGYGVSKRKRSLRTKVAGGHNTSTYQSSEEEDLLLAKCLIDLANARVDTSLVEPEESCASASKDEDRVRNPMTYFNPLVNSRVPLDIKAKGTSTKGLFECKACKKVFNSHQALGGHRASHKKVKGCYAAKQDQLDDSLIEDQDMNTTHDQEFMQSSKSMRKSKIHECSICHRVFSTGQALGGHKRCHWITSNSPDSSKFNFHSHVEQINLRSNMNKSSALDLNIPTHHEDMSRVRRDPMNPLSFEVSTEIQLQYPWSNCPTKDDDVCSENYYLDEVKIDTNDNIGNNIINNNNNNNNNNSNVATQTVDDDEADSKLKLAKLSDLKDMNTNNDNPSHWLQVGIGSTTEVGADS